MALYRLALELGVWDVRRLSDEMTVPEFNRWLAFLKLRNEEQMDGSMVQGAESARSRAKRML